ncbi:MAG TPA: hypothetical protein VF637_14640 [Sphingomicrobium sp.]|jgi:hypothetical protein
MAAVEQHLVVTIGTYRFTFEHRGAREPEALTPFCAERTVGHRDEPT